MASHKHHNRKCVKKKSFKKISGKSFTLKDKKKAEKLPSLEAMAIFLRIYLSDEQYISVCKTGGCCRLVYNTLVADYQEKKEQFIEDKKNGKTDEPYLKYGLKEANEKLLEMKRSGEYPFLNEIHSKILQQAVRNFCTALSNHINYPSSFAEPTFKKKSDHKDSFRVPIDAIPGGQSKNGPRFVKGNRISICSFLMNILFRCSRKDEKFLNKKQKETRNITVSVHPDGKVYASVLTAAKEVSQKDVDTICAFDLGLCEQTVEHRQKISFDDDNFVSLEGDEVERTHTPNLNNFREPDEKHRKYEDKGETKIQHLNKKLKHSQRILSRTEYDVEKGTTQRNKDEKDVKTKNSNKGEFLAKRKERNIKNYLERRAKTKLSHEREESKKQRTPNTTVCNRPSYQKCSNRHEKARKHAAKISAKIANKRSNYNHMISSRMVRENKMIVSEDLNVKGMVKNHSLAKAISSAGWRQLTDMLTYKCIRYNRIYFKIGRFEPSTKTCPVCGYHNDSLTLKDREYVCPQCGTHIIRDEGSSDNICVFGVNGYNSARRAELDEQRGKETESQIIALEFGETGRGDAL